MNDLANYQQHSTARMFADDTDITVSGKSIKEAEVPLMLISIISENGFYQRGFLLTLSKRNIF
jgi:hypothetical protein